MNVDTHATPQRWWHDVRWIAAFLSGGVVGTLLWGLFGPEPRIVVSRETTFLTAPLRADGLPDYSAHALGLLGRDVPPEDNAAVALLHATWPMDLSGPQLTALCRELGIPNAPPAVAPIGLTARDDLLQQQLREWLGRGGPCRDRGIADRAQVEPWTAAECPPLAEWVARNSPALDVLVEGAGRPSFMMPPADLLLASSGRIGNPTFTAFDALNNLVKASLLSRAMLHLGEGRIEAAWRDIHAIHRLARLMAPAGRPDFGITHVLAFRLGATANAATLQLLQTPGLTAEMVSMIRRDLAALPDLPGMLEGLALDRLFAVSLAVSLATLRSEHRIRVLNDTCLTDTSNWMLPTSLDLNVVLRMLNEHHDRMEAAVRESDRPARRRAFDAIERDLAAAVSRPTGWRLADLHAVLNRPVRSAAVGDELLAACSGLPNHELYDRAQGAFVLVGVAAALAEYRTRGLGGPEHPYPDRLDALVPDVLTAVPRDPCSGGPLTYKRSGDGYLLSAVGVDGIEVPTPRLGILSAPTPPAAGAAPAPRP